MKRVRKVRKKKKMVKENMELNRYKRYIEEGMLAPGLSSRHC
jgi:hypothetical protein